MENPSLPHELVVEILLRSSVKSLLRFKCVCKSWLSVISDPHFAKSQFDLAAAVTHRVLLRRNLSSFEIESVDVEPSLYDDSAVVNLRLPGPCRDPCFRIFGSCRGFVFLAHKWSGNITVWNPSTGTHRKILVSAKYTRPSFDFLHGIGYEESSDDYLLVVIGLGDPQIQVFSLKTNVPSVIHGNDDVQFEYLDLGYDFRAGILLNESLHWLVFSPATKLHVVLAFHLIDRSLSEIPLSPELEAELARKPYYLSPELARRRYHLNVMGGYLCLCNEGRGDLDENAEIWVMKEYKVASSWTKSFVLPVTSIAYNHFLPTCFTRCGGLFGSSGSGGLMKLNFNDKAHIVEYHTCLPYKGFVKHHDLYRESLLPLPLPLPSNFDEAKYKESYNPKKQNKKVNKKRYFPWKRNKKV